MLSTELKTQIGHHKEFKADVSSVSPSSIALTKGLRSKRQPLKSLRRPIYVFNSVDNA